MIRVITPFVQQEFTVSPSIRCWPFSQIRAFSRKGAHRRSSSYYCRTTEHPAHMIVCSSSRKISLLPGSGRRRIIGYSTVGWTLELRLRTSGGFELGASRRYFDPSPKNVILFYWYCLGQELASISNTPTSNKHNTWPTQKAKAGIEM